jgi:hypothetical protein
MRVVELESELACVGSSVMERRNVVELNYNRSGPNFVWLTPARVRAPASVHCTSLDAPTTLVHSSRGGGKEVCPNSGPTESRGAIFRHHGELGHRTLNA